MTALDCYQAVLIELNKVHAPNLLLEDFNYFFNKAVSQYINKHYNIYDMNQQATDNLRAVKKTVHLDPNEVLKSDFGSDEDTWQRQSIKSIYGTVKEVFLPLDYIHILNCVCSFKKMTKAECDDDERYESYPAKRLTADTLPMVMQNYYTKPAVNRPYYYINGSDEFTQPGYFEENKIGDPYKGDFRDSAFKSNTETLNGSRTFTLGGGTNLMKFESQEQVDRTGNPNPVRMEIYFGKKGTHELVDVRVDYIRVPQHIVLTQEQIDLTTDTSQILEFPDYVCMEIINELVHIIMENQSNVRLQTHGPISQSIMDVTAQTK